MINLYPLLVEHINRIDAFVCFGRMFAYPERCWLTEMTFSQEPQEPASWAFLTSPTMQPIFRTGTTAECLFEFGAHRCTFSLFVRSCCHLADGKFFVVGRILPQP